MKQLALSFLFVFVFIPENFSQNESIKLRHMEGFKSVKVGGTVNLGITQKTHTILLGYNHYLNEKMFVGADMNLEIGEIDNSNVNNLHLNLYYNYSIIQLQNTYYLNAVAGGFIGKENVKSQHNFDNNTSDAFVYGFLIGVSCEIFISNRICFEPFFTQFVQSGSNLGNAFYNKGLSIKINF